MKGLIIIGAGEVGMELALIIERINELEQEWDILGFVDDDLSKQNDMICGYPIIGTLEELVSFSELNIYAICAIANYKVKKEIELV